MIFKELTNWSFLVRRRRPQRANSQNQILSSSNQILASKTTPPKNGKSSSTLAFTFASRLKRQRISCLTWWSIDHGLDLCSRNFGPFTHPLHDPWRNLLYNFSFYIYIIRRHMMMSKLCHIWSFSIWKVTLTNRPPKKKTKIK